MSDDFEPISPSQPGKREEAQTRRALAGRRILVGALTTAVVILLAVSTYTAVITRGQVLKNVETLRSADRAAAEAKVGTDRIEDCTTPGGKCYQRNQETTGTAVADIGRASLYAAACAVVVGRDEGLSLRVTVERTEECVRDLLSPKP